MGGAGETYSDYSNLITKTGRHTTVSVTRVTSIMIPWQVSIHLGGKKMYSCVLYMLLAWLPVKKE